MSATAIETGTRIGEVVGASTRTFVAQVAPPRGDALAFPRPPAFGSLVRAVAEEDGLETFAVVYHAETGGVDGAHRPLALDMTRAELRVKQPQVFDLLRTDVAAIAIAHRRDGALRHHLPPWPPQVHDFVYACSPADVIAVTGDLMFLRELLAFAEAPADQVVAACLRHAAAARGDDRAFLLSAGQVLSRLLKHDYTRLGAITAMLG